MADDEEKAPGSQKNVTLLWPEAGESAEDVVSEPSLRGGSGSYAPSSLPRPPRLADGALLNNIYEVRGLIARGGMAEVYRGVNALTDEHVAIKVILPHLADDPTVEAMFLREARTLLRLGHPALVQYRLAARDPLLGVLYLVTEFVDGVGLDEAMEQKVAPSLTESIALTRRLADGLSTAHALGAIHRDLSPDNILLPGARMEDAKIIDFGIAKDIATSNPTILGNAFAGKLNFVAPEQLGDFGRHVGPWTDVYSLGLVMLAVSSGKEVDMGESLVDAVDRRRAGPDLSGAPAALRPVFERMLRGDPALRYRSMRDVIDGLDAIQPALVARSTPNVLITSPPTIQSQTPAGDAMVSGPFSDWDDAPQEPAVADAGKDGLPKKARASASRKTSTAPARRAAQPLVVEEPVPKARRRTTTRMAAKNLHADEMTPPSPESSSPVVAHVSRLKTDIPLTSAVAATASIAVSSHVDPSPRDEGSGGGIAGGIRAATPFLVLVALVLLGVTVALLAMRRVPAPVQQVLAPVTADVSPVALSQPPLMAPVPAEPPVAAPPVTAQAQIHQKRRNRDEANRIPEGDYNPGPAVQIVAAPPVAPPPPAATTPVPAAAPVTPPKRKNIFQQALHLLKDNRPRFPVTGASPATPAPVPAPASTESPPR